MPTDGEDSSEEPTGSIRTVPPDSDPEHFPRALAARIGKRDIWIANSGGVEPDHLAAMNLDPAYVVSVNNTASEATTDHYPLKDGFVNDQEQFTEAVETTRQRLREPGTVIVNCAAGISRSTTVSATAIAAEEEQPFEAVVEEIRETRPQARPHPKLKLNAFGYFVSNEDRDDARAQFEELADAIRIRRTDADTIEELLDSNRSA